MYLPKMKENFDPEKFFAWITFFVIGPFKIIFLMYLVGSRVDKRENDFDSEMFLIGFKLLFSSIFDFSSSFIIFAMNVPHLAVGL